ncbi:MULTISPECIES: PQQ-dependent sugar dehydrogenase [unclassified Brevundimonas]|uniref:PQQ-dependent sugar dehydrogenase n=1 Tax=unclassified Brevundimonas TaxID=2622653 RepID=UPI0025B96FC9|nr:MULTISPECIES: PQQ-dependent sugar dehydrogenase [unclassified Brevundimonas]
MRIPLLLAAASIMALTTACGATGQTSETPTVAGQPVENRQPNNPDQKPAFEGQTRAPGVATQGTLTNTVVASGLENPWGLALLPDGNWLVTEKPGRLRIVSSEGRIGAPIAGVPAVDAKGQGGLLDVILSPTFGQDRLVYFSYAQPRQGGNGTAVARARLSDDNTKLENLQVIFEVAQTYDGDKHYGSSLAFAPDGKLYITIGERSDKPKRPDAQNLGTHHGKVVRINADGSVPQDNPFVGREGALPHNFTYGHRNPQGIAIQPGTGAVWTIEHGTRGGDELNLIQAGSNYGWPIAGYGIEYNGQPIPGMETAAEGTVQPVYYWDPVIAPGGMTFYEGSMFPEWKGNALIAGLGGKHLVRLVIENNRVVGEERLLTGLGSRIRDVAVAADGAVWVITDEEDGKLVRLAR